MALKPQDRLIVAADYDPGDGGREQVKAKVLSLTKALKGTGVYIKVNSALRLDGYGLIDEIKSQGLRVFADLKLFDISATLKIDGRLLALEEAPEILTTVCGVGRSSIKALRAELPETEILGVTVLTSLGEAEVKEMTSRSSQEAVLQFAKIGAEAGVDGLVASGLEVEALRAKFPSLTLNTPGIRPKWAMVPGDDQARVVTPGQAIKSGADRVVVGRPITTARDPYRAVMYTLAELSTVDL